MDDLLNSANQLSQQIDLALQKISYDELEATLKKLEQDMSAPNFWADQATANQVAKKAGELKNRLAPWQKVKTDTKEILDLLKFGDAEIKDDLTAQLATVQNSFDKLKSELKLSGQYDDHQAILSIYAGAGGTDAQDWASMLLRMYTRFCESQKWSVNTIEQSAGETAGLKSITIEVNGAYAYGKLKSEHGVHRLVRQSPFNADAKRQTSFAKVEVMPKIEQPAELPIDESDLKIDVFRAGGHGGQSVNTTDSAVRITHLPTGIVVAIQNERSQLQNKETALTILRSKLAQLQLEQHKENLSEIKGPNEQASWGNQIRSYVLHPYKQAKDLRTGYETSDPDKVLNGDLDPLINAYLEASFVNI